ncbi:MAG: hypothetical protein M3R22_00270, partial [Pseudomonadota bacterium]|nr:hypothetical protein [Pseudomonadota bacterium]
RGGRNDRTPRSEGSEAAPNDEGAQQSFVDTMPNSQNAAGAPSAAGAELEGDRQGARRRNRRGGRGRDRDESNGGEGNAQAPAIDESSMAARNAVAGSEGNGSATFAEGNGSAAALAEGGEATVDDAGNPIDSRGEGSASRRRRGGRGRDRLPRGAQPEGGGNGAVSSESAGDAGLATAAAIDPRFAVDEREFERDSGRQDEPGRMHPQPHEIDAVPIQRMLPPIEEAPAFEQRQPERAPVAAPAPAAIVVPAATPRDYVLPIDSLEAVAEGAGLQWVNSDADKIRAAQAAMASAPTAAHVPREIRRAEPIDQGPLVLVETRKDLSQVRLPFETQTPNS